MLIVLHVLISATPCKENIENNFMTASAFVTPFGVNTHRDRKDRSDAILALVGIAWRASGPGCRVRRQMALHWQYLKKTNPTPNQLAQKIGEMERGQGAADIL